MRSLCGSDNAAASAVKLPRRLRARHGRRRRSRNVRSGPSAVNVTSAERAIMAPGKPASVPAESPGQRCRAKYGLDAQPLKNPCFTEPSGSAGRFLGGLKHQQDVVRQIFLSRAACGQAPEPSPCARRDRRHACARCAEKKTADLSAPQWAARPFQRETPAYPPRRSQNRRTRRCQAGRSTSQSERAEDVL